MCTAGKEQEALKLLEKLADSAIEERRYAKFMSILSTYDLIVSVLRFGDASHYYWLLSKACQEATQRIPTGTYNVVCRMDPYTRLLV